MFDNIAMIIYFLGYFIILTLAIIAWSILLTDFFGPPVVAEKLEKECKKGTIIISQRFEVERWKDYLIKEILRKNNSTFIYKL